MSGWLGESCGHFAIVNRTLFAAYATAGGLGSFENDTRAAGFKAVLLMCISIRYWGKRMLGIA